MDDKPIRLLLVEDNPADARLVEELLKDVADGSFTLESVSRLAEAMRRVAEESFDAVLLDLRLPDSQDIDTFLRLHKHAPGLPVIVLTGTGNGVLGNQAVAAGAQDYLVKGRIDANELARVIRYSILRHRTQAQELEKMERVERGKVLGFVGAKGGVGTTTVAVNVAAALAQRGKTVTLAELVDGIGDFSAQLGRSPAENLSQLAALGVEGIARREIAARLVGSAHGPRVLFGPQRADELAELQPEVVEEVVEGLAGMSECAVLDLGSRPSPGVRAAARHCDYLALVVQPGAIGVRTARVALETLHSWNLGQDRIGAVIVNRFGTVAPVSIQDYSAKLGCEIVGVVPPDVEGCLAAEQRGKPIVIDQPEGIPAQNLMDLAARLAADKIVAMHF